MSILLVCSASPIINGTLILMLSGMLVEVRTFHVRRGPHAVWGCAQIGQFRVLTVGIKIS